MARSLPLPHLLLLFGAFRLAALLLYRPGGLIDPAAGSPYFFVLNYFPSAPPLLAPLLGGVVMLPFELLTLYSVARLTRRAGQPAEATDRALWWAISPLSLWHFLTGTAPLAVAGMLVAFWLLRQGRRTWLLVAIFAMVGVLAEGPTSFFTALLLPLIVLLVPDPLPLSALYTAGALISGPFARATAAQEPLSTVFNLLFFVALFPAAIELGTMVVPSLSWHRWRGFVWRGAAALLVLLSTLLLFTLLPPHVKAARLETAPLAPALAEMSAAPEGWFVSDSHALWEQSVSLGAGHLHSRVLTARNLPALRTELARVPASLWLLDSNSAESSVIVESLVDGYFIGDALPIADGSILRRFVTSAAPGARHVPLGARFADGVTLVEVTVPTTVRAGAHLPVELTWEGDTGTATLFMHLLAADGSLVAQRDGLPRPTPDRHAVHIPAALLPGQYTLSAGRYDPDTLQRIGLSRGGDTIVLSTIEVTE